MGRRERVKSAVKMIAGSVFYYGGVFHLVRCLNNLMGRRLTIVTYHRVTDKRLEEMEFSLPFLFVTQETFTKQLLFLKKHYRVTSFRELESLSSHGRLPRNSLIITFDDGYEDNFSRAYPLLKRHGVGSTIFLTVGVINDESVAWWDELFCRMKALSRNGPKAEDTALSSELSEMLRQFNDDASKLFRDLNGRSESELRTLVDTLRGVSEVSEILLYSENRFMTWEQAREMKGTVEFGSHTWSHLTLEGQAESRVRDELARSKEELEERLAEKVTAFSYPAGSYSEEAKHLVGECGYSYAVTMNKGINDERDKYALKRVNIWEGSASVFGRFSRAVFALRLGGIFRSL